jgi:hypothetical protein
LFLIYIYDLPQLVKRKALPIFFADDTSFIISNSDPLKMDEDVKVVFEVTQKWFNSNRMLLNYNKTNFMQFTPITGHWTLDIAPPPSLYTSSLPLLFLIVEPGSREEQRFVTGSVCCVHKLP